MAGNETKNVILTRKLNNVLYDLMVKTTIDMVYDGEYTLTERLSDIADALQTNYEDIKSVSEQFAKLVDAAPVTFQTFKEIWDYVNINGKPESELIKLIRSKQDAEPDKGLSSNDLTDILYEKLVNNYTREELDAKFKIIIDESDNARFSERVAKLENAPNILCSESATAPTGVVDYGCWYQIIRKDA